MKFEIKNNANIRGMVKGVEDSFRRTLELSMPTLKNGIQARTKSGQDVKNNSFQGYSNAYEAAKARALGSASPVNLTYSGDMLNSLKTRVDANKLQGTISVTGQFNQQKAKWNQEGTATVAPRKFLGLDSKQIQRLIRDFVNQLNKRS
jgi:hypothetical protein